MVLYSHGGGFSGPVVSEEGGDLPFVEAKRQPVDCQLLSVTINLHQVLDVDSGLQVSRLLLDTHSWRNRVDTRQEVALHSYKLLIVSVSAAR